MIHAPAGGSSRSRSVHRIGGNSAKPGSSAITGSNRSFTACSREHRWPPSSPPGPASPRSDRGRWRCCGKPRGDEHTASGSGAPPAGDPPPIGVGTAPHPFQRAALARAAHRFRAEAMPVGFMGQRLEDQVAAEIGEGWPRRCRASSRRKEKKADVGNRQGPVAEAGGWLSRSGCGRKHIRGLGKPRW